MSKESKRKEKEEIKKKKVYMLTNEQIFKIKEDAVAEAIDKSFILMLGLPVMILHDHINDLWRKDVDGKNREERFTDYVLDLYESFSHGYLTLDDISSCLREECGIDFRIKMTNKRK